jgi:hypothetical protein
MELGINAAALIRLFGREINICVPSFVTDTAVTKAGTVTTPETLNETCMKTAFLES